MAGDAAFEVGRQQTIDLLPPQISANVFPAENSRHHESFLPSRMLSRRGVDGVRLSDATVASGPHLAA